MTGFAARVATAVWVLVLVACLALSFVFTRGYLEELQKNLGQRGRIIGESVAHESELALLTGDVAGLARIAARAYAARGLRYCGILDDRGGIVASAGSRQHGVPPERKIGQQIWGAVLGVAPAVWEFRTPVTIAELRPQDEELTFFDMPRRRPKTGHRSRSARCWSAWTCASCRRATGRC